MSRSGLLESMIGESSGEGEKNCVLQLHDIPGGAKTFLLAAKFCYGVRIEFTARNVVSLRCAAELLRMSEEHGEGNLIAQTEEFLADVFQSWADSNKALETCNEVLPLAEELLIVSRCIDSMAMKACEDRNSVSQPTSARSASQSPDGTVLWNGIRTTTTEAHTTNEGWWYEDASILKLPLFKRLILAIDSRGIKPERLAGSLMHYANKHLPLIGRQSGVNSGQLSSAVSNVSTPSDLEQKSIFEEIVKLLPDQKGATPTKFLVRLLRTSMMLHTNSTSVEVLEKKIGAQLDQADLDDLLIQNLGLSAETLYDVDCVQRMLEYFLQEDNNAADPTSNSTSLEEGQLVGAPQSLTPMTMVASLIDRYLAEIAGDINLKLAKFQSIAAVIPDYAWPIEDGIYRAIDIYLKVMLATFS